MINKKLNKALDDLIMNWRSQTFNPKVTIENDIVVNASKNSLIFPLSSINYIDKSDLSFALHAPPIDFSMIMEQNDILHLALVNIRVTPTQQPFITPSQSECRQFNDLLLFVYSNLRDKYKKLSSKYISSNSLSCSLNLNFIVSMGYLQISSSLTSREFIPVDTAQGITIDFIGDRHIQEEHLISSIKAVNNEYVKLCSILTKQGKL